MNENQKKLRTLLLAKKLTSPFLFVFIGICIASVLIFKPGVIDKHPLIYYLFIGLFILILVFSMILRFILKSQENPESAKKFDDFFNKYNIDPEHTEDSKIDQKLKEIADINSVYPDNDKKFARQLIEFKKSLNE